LTRADLTGADFTGNPVRQMCIVLTCKNEMSSLFNTNGHLLVQNTTVLDSFNSSIIKMYWMYLIILLKYLTLHADNSKQKWRTRDFYLIPNQIIVLLCCLLNLIICP
jgi:hypothetical protein